MSAPTASAGSVPASAQADARLSLDGWRALVRVLGERGERSSAAAAELERLDADPGSWDPPTAPEVGVELARTFGRLSALERAPRALKRSRLIAQALARGADTRSIAEALGLAPVTARPLIAAYRARYLTDEDG